MVGQRLSDELCLNPRMAATQLWLFPPPKPLVERFGSEYFRELPDAPVQTTLRQYQSIASSKPSLTW